MCIGKRERIRLEFNIPSLFLGRNRKLSWPWIRSALLILVSAGPAKNNVENAYEILLAKSFVSKIYTISGPAFLPEVGFENPLRTL